MFDKDDKKGLANLWKWYHLWYVPADKIRKYYGEKIAFYFEFLGHYTFWLIPAALLGFVVWILNKIFLGTYWFKILHLVYVGCIVIWATWMFEAWN